jgi:ankyrin repeat protein
MSEPAASAKAFVAAVRSGDAAALRTLLEASPALRARLDEPLFSFHAPAMVELAKDGDVATMRVLLEYGADINAAAAWEPGPYTALHHAVGGSGRERPEVAAFLLKHGATVDLHSAVGLDRIAEVTAELDRDPGAVRRRGPDGQMPLHLAISPAMADLLLARGAAIDARCIDHGSTAAMWLALRRPRMARHLVARGARADLFMAALAGDADMVGHALADDPAAREARLGHSPWTREERGNIYVFTVGENGTALHAAAIADQPEAVTALIAAGLDVNVRGTYDDATPLHVAAWHGRLAAAARLLDLGAAIDADSGAHHRNSPLGWAIVNAQPAMVKLLLARGAPPRPYYVEAARHGRNGDFRDFSNGRTADYEACERLLTARA